MALDQQMKCKVYRPILPTKKDGQRPIFEPKGMANGQAIGDKIFYRPADKLSLRLGYIWSGLTLVVYLGQENYITSAGKRVKNKGQDQSQALSMIYENIVVLILFATER